MDYFNRDVLLKDILFQARSAAENNKEGISQVDV